MQKRSLVKNSISPFILFLTGLVFTGAIFGETGISYQPESMDTALDAPILLYVSGINGGMTSAKSNNLRSVLIKSANREKLKVVNFYLVRVIEGLDDQDNVLTYTKKEYELSDDGIAKLNRELKRPNIRFSDLLKNVDMKSCSRKKTGSSVATKSSVFKKFRKVKVYNLVVEDSNGRQNKLQIYMESFQYPHKKKIKETS